MMNAKSLVIGLAMFSALPVAAAQVTVTETVTVTKPAATMTLSFVPVNPSIVCTLAPGSVVSAVKVAWSDGSTTVPTMNLISGGPEFALVGSNVVVNPSGTALASLCATIPAGGSVQKTVTVVSG